MRIIELPAEEIERQCICLGFEGENNHTRVLFGCGRVFSEYPFAAASLAVQPPVGEAYPVAVVREEDAVVWDVRNSSLACEGRGEYQLSFTSGDTVVKSFIGSFIVSRSILGEGEAPEPLADFLTEAGAALTAIPETIRAALADAKASGEFDGPKGDKGDPGEPGTDSLHSLAPVETGRISGRAYAAGEWFVLSDDGDEESRTCLYRATSAIAAGDRIEPGTNCEQTTVAEELSFKNGLIIDGGDSTGQTAPVVPAGIPYAQGVMF